MKRTFKQTLDYLYTQLPMYQRVGQAAFKKDLTNIKALCKALGNPQNQFKSIHIAGTNGKGSTTHLLSSVMQASGKKVGLYTSPHYKDFRERIKIGAEYVPKKWIVDFVKKHDKDFKRIQPSFFEITVAMAFAYFSEQKVDVAVIETGLGGRLDSTNILKPELCIITNISMDHQAMLGNTLKKIAGEKAGIIKKEIPVIIGESQSEIESVFIKKANQKNAPIYFADDEYQVEAIKETLENTYYSVRKNKKIYFKNLLVNLRGPFQYKNIIATLKALEIINDRLFPINKKSIEIGFKQLKKLTRYQGRWQILGDKPLIICDSAHNEGGLKIVMKQLSQMKYTNLHIVIGFVNDKTLDKVLQLFPEKATYYFAKANIPRGLPAKNLQEKTTEFNLIGRSYVSVKNALKAAKRKALPKDLIYVGGSIFVVAEVI